MSSPSARCGNPVLVVDALSAEVGLECASGLEGCVGRYVVIELVGREECDGRLKTKKA